MTKSARRKSLRRAVRGTCVFLSYAATRVTVYILGPRCDAGRASVMDNSPQQKDPEIINTLLEINTYIADILILVIKGLLDFKTFPNQSKLQTTRQHAEPKPESGGEPAKNQSPEERNAACAKNIRGSASDQHRAIVHSAFSCCHIKGLLYIIEIISVYTTPYIGTSSISILTSSHHHEHE